ncbi:unnamed protein product [Albugo candida]|uniref:Uncharacterized protein n=1 Tax=Albugo candida TaxID=65357 RepID=A0A024GLP3_9STRA|nr:unnamed protein product [Albugo candida]|eukprot:CCI47262.1 unnamed protein product [Albugo candida]
MRTTFLSFFWNLLTFILLGTVQTINTKTCCLKNPVPNTPSSKVIPSLWKGVVWSYRSLSSIIESFTDKRLCHDVSWI